MLNNLFRKKHPPLIGLDIGTRFVKAVLLDTDGDQYKLVQFAVEPIAGNAFSDREIKDFDPVNNALRKVKIALKSKVKDVAVAVSGSSVINKIVYMDPDQSDFELEGQIEIEADSLIPYPLEEVYLDFEELGESKTHVGKVDVLLSAAHRDLIDSRITLLREVQYEPKVMDVETYALGNALGHFGDVAEEGNTVLVSIGAAQLQVCVLRGGRVLYSKEHGFGVNSLIQDLSLVHTLEPQETERQLLNDELPGSWRENTYPIFLSNLQNNIARAMQAYISTTHAERPTVIHLCGGGAAIPGIDKDLESELAVEVKLFNPFENMKVSDKVAPELLAQHAPQLAIAAGLASRSFSPWHI
ncbi:pilus assembly protein PilM [Aestuariibacter halophilus]|uniref:Pilus assembly protein PilM n=1 Tax=Fluctibacter halophilus TaxID=226011 RepID=A0ABS8G9W6_9ALTE|nr:type IV pilus assembly protein PilM [Aestuariibacter halophilus]MCC2617377.1 pilus assembly protein PilM [Aestuariibacter halophilus]